MKFLCDRARLEAALSPVLPAIPPKEPPKQALRNLHLRAEEDGLVIQGSNMELSVEVRLDSVKVDEPGACLIPAKPFQQLVHEVPDPTLRVEVTGGTLELQTSSGKFEIVTGNADDYPDLVFSATGPAAEVPADQLAQLVQSTEFACAREATRYAMNGVLLSAKDGRLSAVATDGRRLAMRAAPVDSLGDKDEWSVLLPHKSLGSAVKSLSNLSEGPVGMQLGDSNVVFSVPQASISIQRISGNFPNFEEVLPRDCKNLVEMNRVLLEANLRRATVLTEEMNPAIRIAFEGSQARFESEASGVGSSETAMDIELNGPGGSSVFNPHFLSEGLRFASADTLRFEFDDGNSPAKLMLDENYVYVVMPITGV